MLLLLKLWLLLLLVLQLLKLLLLLQLRQIQARVHQEGKVLRRELVVVAQVVPQVRVREVDVKPVRENPGPML
jgi:hypothetical protein